MTVAQTGSWYLVRRNDRSCATQKSFGVNMNFKTLCTATGLFALSLHADAKPVTGRFNFRPLIQKNRGDSSGIVITQNSTYLFPGQTFEIAVFAKCSSDERVKKVRIGGTDLPMTSKGVATFSFQVAAVGLHSIPVEVTCLNKRGAWRKENHLINYTVGQAIASVALDRMNVLYIGVNNPVSVAASGAGDDKLTIRIEGAGGSVAKTGAGRYDVRVVRPSDDCLIAVFVDGKEVGVSRFRVRNLPLPVGSVGGHVSGDSVSAGNFKAQQGVSAGLSGFPFELTYEIVGYTLIVNTQKGESKSVACTGAGFSEQARDLLAQYLVPGTTVIIGGLLAKGGDGRLMRLAPLEYFMK